MTPPGWTDLGGVMLLRLFCWQATEWPFCFTILPMTLTQPTLEDLYVLARVAGEILRSGYGLRHTITHKGRIDLVTEYDRRSEAYLLSQVREKFPGHTILSEESGLQPGHADHCWYIDPLDGTTNYAHGMPIFCVSIAYAEKDEMTLGVVYDPLRDEMFGASKGAGAYLNGERIQVSDADSLLQSLLVTGFAYDDWVIRTNLQHFAYFSTLCQAVRRFGSAALDFCYIAAGRLDGYWEMSLQPWDSAAGSIIAREAGAIVSAPDGDPDFLKPPGGVIVANPAMHALLYEGLNRKV
jgi:myo-inositol-1(or 4)-monophosphatase